MDSEAECMEGGSDGWTDMVMHEIEDRKSGDSCTRNLIS